MRGELMLANGVPIVLVEILLMPVTFEQVVGKQGYTPDVTVGIPRDARIGAFLRGAQFKRWRDQTIALQRRCSIAARDSAALCNSANRLV